MPPVREFDALTCPPSENPMGLLSRLGWRRVDARLLPSDAVLNPLVYGLIWRRGPGLREEVLPLLPWLVLAGLEAGAFHLADAGLSFAWVLLALLVEVVLVPPLLGMAAQWHLAMHFRRNCQRVPFEELRTTLLTPRELLFGFLVRPLSYQHAAILLLNIYSATLLGGYVIWHVAEGLVWFEPFDVVLAIILLLFRSYVHPLSINLAVAYALRAVVFIGSFSDAVLRMMRDWLWPAGLLFPLAPLFPVGLVMVVGRVDVPLLQFMALVVLILTPWLFAVLPGFMRDTAFELFYWVPRQLKDWVLVTEGGSSHVPERLLKGWPVENSPELRRARQRRREERARR